jgi:CubicO group peptidase (beta-lactamase class C family)
MEMFQNKIKKMVFVFGLCLLAQNVFGQSPKAKAIDDFIKPFAGAKHFSGVVLATENGKIIYEKAFGLANAPHQVTNKPITRFGVASLTKPMTLVVLAGLIEQKKIALSDTVNKYIPDFPKGDKITIEMLAQHRSGIPHRVTTPEEEKTAYTLEDMIEKIKKADLAFEPGADRLYSSAGYTTLAKILEIASGKSYSQLLQQYVFKPAAMTDSLNFDSEDIIPHRADDYLIDASGYANAPLIDFSFLTGAGSVFSTAKDIHAFGEAVAGGKFGELVKKNLAEKDVFISNGSTNGFRAYVRINQPQRYGFVVMSNLASGANDLVINNVRAILEGKEAAAPVVPNPKIQPGSNKNLSDFEGKYKLGNSQFEIFVKGDQLYAGPYKLLSVGKDRFYNFWSYAEISFVRDEKGTVKGLEWNGSGGKSEWTRQN